jgi:hypothetical protein
MKINEITEAGILDKLVQSTKAAVQGYTQSRDTRVNDQAIAQMSQVAARAWGKMKQNLERINGYTPLSKQQLSQQLVTWVDSNLLGSYQLKSTSGQFQGLVANLVNKVVSEPAQTEQSFSTILTNASKLALDPESEPTRDKQSGQPAGNTAPFKVINDIATAGTMELNLNDPQQKEIYDRIRDEVAKGDIKV